MMDGRKKILLGQLNSNGDCLYATSIARQIKTDYPGCHLTWAIGTMCLSVLNDNPFVDDVWEIPLKSIDELVYVWPRFEQEALQRKIHGDFDEVYLTQIAPGNVHNYNGSIRSSIFSSYPHPITVPLAPVLRLNPAEVEKVRRFAESHHLADNKHVILFECSPNSGQSFVTPYFALEVARKLVANVPDVCVILSSNKQISSYHERIIDGSALSLRENAELTKYCNLLVGCSSGISWICTTDWAKPLPMIQLIKSDSIWFNSVVCDHEEFGLPSESIIEMSDSSPDMVSNCIITALISGIEYAKSTYHIKLKVPLNYFAVIVLQLINEGELFKAIHFSIINIKKHGIKRQFIFWPIYLLNKKIAKIYSSLKV